MSAPAPVVGAELATVLLVASLLGAACRRWLRLPVVGELVGGVLLGPSLLGAHDPDLTRWFSAAGAGPTSVVEVVAAAAAALLVGVTALQLDLALVRHESGVIVRVAAAALVVPAALGMAAAAALPASLHGARSHEIGFLVFVGVALGVSAPPMPAITLMQLGLFRKRIGRLGLASAAIDDVAGWLLLAVTSAIVVGSGGGRVLLTAGGLVVLVLLPIAGRRPAAALLAAAARRGAVPAVIAALVVLALGALIARRAGLELPIGAMSSGILLSRCPPLPDAAQRALGWFSARFCAPLFLGTAGMQLDLHVVSTSSVLLCGLVLLVVAGAGKVGGGYLGARSAGVPHATALATGAGLNARGMVEILIASIGLRIGLISAAMYGILVGIAVVTSIVTPVLLRRLAPREAAASHSEPSVLDDKPPRVVHAA